MVQHVKLNNPPPAPTNGTGRKYSRRPVSLFMPARARRNIVPPHECSAMLTNKSASKNWGNNECTGRQVRAIFQSKTALLLVRDIQKQTRRTRVWKSEECSTVNRQVNAEFA